MATMCSAKTPALGVRMCFGFGFGTAVTAIVSLSRAGCGLASSHSLVTVLAACVAFFTRPTSAKMWHAKLSPSRHLVWTNPAAARVPVLRLRRKILAGLSRAHLCGCVSSTARIAAPGEAPSGDVWPRQHASPLRGKGLHKGAPSWPDIREAGEVSAEYAELTREQRLPGRNRPARGV